MKFAIYAFSVIVGVMSTANVIIGLIHPGTFNSWWMIPSVFFMIVAGVILRNEYKDTGPS